MSIEVMLAVLLGAALHASWNAFVRAGADKFLDTVLVVSGAGMVTALMLPLIPTPAPESYPYLAASVLVHVAYFSLVALSYRDGELSLAYPIMRGIPPAISALGAAFLLGESPSLGGWIGILLISSGILLLCEDSRRYGLVRLSSVKFALMNAVIIVIYTLIDGVGARLSAHPFSYTGWMFLFTAAILSCVSLLRSGCRLLEHMRSNWRKSLTGGLFTLTSYGLALWAMTHAPIALVAALRETSVVFAALIAVTVLKEQVGRIRFLSIVCVCSGAVVIKLF